MIARTVKIQLVIFTILTIVAMLLIAFTYTHIPTLMGYNQIKLSASFPATGGLYPNANVTYRGYTIGKVKKIDILPDGVDVTMSIDKTHLPPADSRAEVHSVSAIGEQFVDLVPGPGPSQPITDGYAIPMSRTSLPISIADVLQDSQELLKSLNQKDLTTTLDEGAAAFRGIGPDLGRAIDHAQSLASVADKNYQGTHDLINQAPRFLDGQIASSPAIRAWASDLASFSGQLRESDGAFRDVLVNVPPAAEHVGDFVQDLNSRVPTLLSSGNTLAKLAKAYHAPIEQILVLYPMFVAADLTFVPKDRANELRINLQTHTNAPTCSIGWIPPGQPGGARPSTELSDTTLPADSYCRLPQTDPTMPRSARQLPCFEPGSPPGRRAATIYQCRGKGFTTDQPSRSTIAVPESAGKPSPPGESVLRSNQDGDGQSSMAGQEPLSAIGAISQPAPKRGELTWQKLLQGGAER